MKNDGRLLAIHPQAMLGDSPFVTAFGGRPVSWADAIPVLRAAGIDFLQQQLGTSQGAPQGPPPGLEQAFNAFLRKQARDQRGST